MSMQERVFEYLSGDVSTMYSAKEICEVLGVSEEDILEVKHALEQGVDDTVYRRRIITKGKVVSVYYGLRGDNDTEPGIPEDKSEWERNK